MLNRRLILLTFALCFVILVSYTLSGGSGFAERVVLIPTEDGGKDALQQGHHAGGGNGHEHFHNNVAPPVAGVGSEVVAQKPGSSSPSKAGSSGSSDDGSKWGYGPSASSSGPKVEFVVSAVRATNTSWIGEHFPAVPAHVYVADDPKAPFTVLKNIGHESNVYLTYIIDHYDSLPDIVVFLHGRRYQWHNDDPLYGEFRACTET